MIKKILDVKWYVYLILVLIFGIIFFLQGSVIYECGPGECSWLRNYWAFIPLVLVLFIMAVKLTRFLISHSPKREEPSLVKRDMEKTKTKISPKLFSRTSIIYSIVLWLVTIGYYLYYIGFRIQHLFNSLSVFLMLNNVFALVIFIGAILSVILSVISIIKLKRNNLSAKEGIISLILGALLLIAILI